MNDKTLRTLEFDKVIKILVEYTASDLGKEISSSLKPYTGHDEVLKALEETSEGVSFIFRRGSPPLGGIHDLRGVLKRVKKGGVLNPGELLNVGDTLRACRNLINYTTKDRIDDKDSTLGVLIGSLYMDKKLENKIESSIENEDEVSDNATGVLAKIRRQIRDNQYGIRDKLNQIIRSSKHKKFMQDPVVTIRGDRFVVPVKQEYRNEVPGLVHDYSSSGATIFIEPMAVVEANNVIKQLKIKEAVEIEKILKELTAQIYEILDHLFSNISILARVDFIFAKAKISLEYNCMCPKINRDKKIVIKKGRHPLIDKDKVVPIDIWIGGEFNTLVITGPNTGGKTVTLKTVGLFILMAQAGLHIPVKDNSIIHVFDTVYADIGDEQSIEQSLSTFSSHMTNIIRIIDNANSNSMVLLDELGAGTDPTEGSALAVAILEHLKKKEATTIATTHYTELKTYALTSERVENACCEFDIETLKPTYRLLMGIPGRSNAFEISERLGLQTRVIEKAKSTLAGENIRFEDVLATIEKSRNTAENEKALATKHRAEIESLKNALEKKNDELKAQKEKIIKDAKLKAKEILVDAKDLSEQLIGQAKDLKKENDLKIINSKINDIRQDFKKNVGKIEKETAVPLMPRKKTKFSKKDFKPGMDVNISNLNMNGVVVSGPDKEGELIVQAGVMKINVHMSNLIPVNTESEKAKTHVKANVSKAKEISARLDLRGENLDNAIEITDKYLDDVAMAGLKEVVIIHGKGTGTLRSGIHAFLKNNHYVKSFRLGKYGEGEAGVTIVEIK